MVDNLTPQDPGPLPEAVVPDGGGEKQGFMSTTKGKIIVIGGAVLAFGLIATLVVFAVMTFVLVDVVDEASDALVAEIEAQGDVDSESAKDEPEVSLEPDEVSMSSIFTFRDIFEPLIKAPVSEDATSGGSTAPGEEGGPTVPDTLYLQDVVVDNGVTMAVLTYNGTEYILPPGGVIPGTPWQVLSVGSQSVVMLYGDSQVTLIIGQGVSSK